MNVSKELVALIIKSAKTVGSGVVHQREPMMLREKPNKLNPDEGMDEGVQKMYDGINDEGNPSRKYDQLNLPVDKKQRDWIDDQQMVRKTKDTRGAGKYYDNAVEFHVNPKLTGEKVPPVGLDEEVLEQILKEKLIHHEDIESTDVDRDETQKYKTVDEKTFNENYWQEEGLHRTRLI